MEKTSSLKFSLSMDGSGTAPENIFIGKDNWHPGNCEFTIQNEKNTDEANVVVVMDPWFYDDWGVWPGPGFPPMHPFPRRHGFPHMP